MAERPDVRVVRYRKDGLGAGFCWWDNPRALGGFWVRGFGRGIAVVWG